MNIVSDWMICVNALGPKLESLHRVLLITEGSQSILADRLSILFIGEKQENREGLTFGYCLFRFAYSSPWYMR